MDKKDFKILATVLSIVGVINIVSNVFYKGNKQKAVRAIINNHDSYEEDKSNKEHKNNVHYEYIEATKNIDENGNVYYTVPNGYQLVVKQVIVVRNADGTENVYEPVKIIVNGREIYTGPENGILETRYYGERIVTEYDYDNNVLILKI